jgi:glutamate 5-kinase
MELEELHHVAGGGGRWGTGGMTTKLAAARIATSSGIRVRLADGRDPAVLDALFAGDRVGTVFQPSDAPLPDRKGWLAHALLPVGSVRVDKGAEAALRRRGASLLAVGIQAVEGRFERQQPVRILNGEGQEVGRGICALSSDELRRIMGLSSQEVRRQLGVVGTAVVHRDQMVLTAPPADSAR